MAGERDRLLADALHQVAVGGEHIGPVVDQVVAELGRQHALGDRHADRIAEPLAERAGGGLDTHRVAVLGMARRARAELAEAFDLVEGHALVAQKIEQRVEQHRAVAGREHEAVAVGPGRIGRIEFEHAGEQHGGDVGRPHGQAGMPGLGLLHRIHRQHPDRVRHPLMLSAGLVADRGGCCGEGGLRAGHDCAERLVKSGSTMRTRGVKEAGRAIRAMHRRSSTKSSPRLTLGLQRT